MKKLYFLHPLLIAVYPILFLYASNVGEVPALGTVGPIAGVCMVTLILLYGSGWVWRNKYKAAILLSVFWMLFFSYGYVYEILPIGRQRNLLLLYGVLFVGCFIGLIRLRQYLEDVTRILNWTVLCLVCITVADIGLQEFSLRRSLEETSAQTLEQSAGPDTPEIPPVLPDIYYLTHVTQLNAKRSIFWT